MPSELRPYTRWLFNCFTTSIKAIHYFLPLTTLQILRGLKNGIDDSLLMELDHFNDEDLIYELIFADVLDAYQRGKQALIHVIYDSRVYDSAGSQRSRGSGRDKGCSQCFWHEKRAVLQRSSQQRPAGLTGRSIIPTTLLHLLPNETN